MAGADGEELRDAELQTVRALTPPTPRPQTKTKTQPSLISNSDCQTCLQAGRDLRDAELQTVRALTPPDPNWEIKDKDH